MSEWHPITDSPKFVENDGDYQYSDQLVLYYPGHGRASGITVGIATKMKSGKIIFGAPGYHGTNFTHWMRPEPPK